MVLIASLSFVFSGCLEEGLEALLKATGSNLLILKVSHCPNLLTDRSLWLASCYCRALQAVTYRLVHKGALFSLFICPYILLIHRFIVYLTLIGQLQYFTGIYYCIMTPKLLMSTVPRKPIYYKALMKLISTLIKLSYQLNY